MQSSLRVVTQLPLSELFDESGSCAGHRGRPLSTEDIRRLLQAVAVRFVVADVGAPLLWVNADRTFEFWRHEVILHLAQPEEQAQLERFPGEYCYFASEWAGPDEDNVRIILLERHH
jgi:hypothetical protein